MAVTTLTDRSPVYATDGIVDTFATTFQFYEDTELVVHLDGIAQVLTTDYTVTGGDGSTGSVVFNTPPATGSEVIVYRAVPYTQPDNFDSDTIPAETIEQRYDKITMMVQQLAGRIGGTGFFAGGFLSGDGTSWDALGLPITNAGDGEFASDLVTKAQLDAITGINGNVSTPILSDIGKVWTATGVGRTGWSKPTSGLPNLISYTTDAWVSRSASEANSWVSVAWSPELDLFAAVSTGGTNRVMTSSDGITWAAQSASEANSWNNVIWASQIELFVAVSSNGTNQVMTSPDGTTWTARAAASVSAWRAVAWSPQLTLLAAVATDGSVMTSPDGTTWTSRTASEANIWRDIVWAAELGLFVAVSGDGVNRVMTSPDGITWTGRAAAEANNWSGITYSFELGLLVAVCTGTGPSRVMISTDGIVWTAVSVPLSAWSHVTYAPSIQRFVAVASSGTYQVMSSSDGLVWTPETAAEANSWNELAWSPQLSRFAAVASSGTNRVMTSDTTLEADNLHLMTSGGAYILRTPAQTRSDIGLGTAAVLNTGNNTGDIPLIAGGNKLPVAILPAADTVSIGAIRIASDSEVSAGVSATTAVTPASFVKSHFAAKAFCTFDGTVAVGAVSPFGAVGIASVEKMATGRFKITMSTARADLNYVVLGTIRRKNSGTGGFVEESALSDFAARTTTIFEITTHSNGGGLTDFELVQVIVFGK